MQAFSLYLHVPFCRHRCAYCDFNTYAGMDGLMPAYVDALLAEIRGTAAAAGERLPAHTVFFGGGTPSLLPLEALERILKTLDAAFLIQSGAEITLEANPGTVDEAYLRGLRAVGVNRISFGMQSADAGELRFLERQHSTLDVFDSFRAARRAGFEQINLDLIFGLPEQTLESWRKTLELTLALSPDHLSLYSLTVEKGTPLYRWVMRGMVSQPDPDAAADMYDLAEERLEQAGLAHYEVSNWARAESECRHNLQYWRNLPYLGFGAGAHGYAAGKRTAVVSPIPNYIQRMSGAGSFDFPATPATHAVTEIDAQTEMQETMMVGLRLLEEGVSAAGFAARFGRALADVFGTPVSKLQRQGLLEWSADGDRLRLTRRGHLLGNQVFMQFVG